MDPDIVAADFVLVDLDFNRAALAIFLGQFLVTASLSHRKFGNGSDLRLVVKGGITRS